MTVAGINNQGDAIQMARRLTPGTWQWQRLKNAAIINRRALSEETAPDFEFDYVDVGSVTQDGGFDFPDRVAFEDAPSRARRLVLPGDTIVSTVRTYLRAIAFIPSPADNLVVSTGFATVTPRLGVDSRFLFWWLRSTYCVEEIVGRSVGVGYPAVNQTDIADVGIPVPPVPEQRRIAEFLDKETRRVDGLIGEQLHLVSLLSERWASALDRVIWRGGDGKRPPTMPLWRATDEARPIIYGIVLPGPNVQEGVLLVKGGDVRPHRLVPETLNRTTVEIEALHARSRLLPGDILYAIRGSIGDAAMVPESLAGANITQDLARISPAVGVDPRWLLFALQSPRFFSQMEREARGATIRGVNIWTLRKGRVPDVPPETQRAMAAELAALDAKLAILLEEARTQVDLLREHWQAVVAAAVTGRLEMNGKAA